MNLFNKTKKEKMFIISNTIGMISSIIGIVFSSILIGLNIINHNDLKIEIFFFVLLQFL